MRVHYIYSEDKIYNWVRGIQYLLKEVMISNLELIQ